MLSVPLATSQPISVLIANSNRMQCQLLVSALHRRPEFHVSSCAMDVDEILHAVARSKVEIAVLGAGAEPLGHEMAVVRRLHLAHPSIAKVLLLDIPDRDSVVSAFRSGARGVFCFSRYPFRLLCKCIHAVHRGEIWVGNDELQHLIELVSQVPSLRVVNAHGLKLLTPREEQVVALVADGLSNREVADELKLSEHTVKKYLYRIFDKLGISSRVELVLYAVSHGGAREAEWIAGGVG